MLVRVEWGWPGRKSRSMIRKNCSIVKSRLVELKCMSAGVVNPLWAVLDNFGDNKVRFWSTTCTTTTSTTTTDIGGMGGQLLALRARWSGDSAICPPALIICTHIALSFPQFYERNMALIIFVGELFGCTHTVFWFLCHFVNDFLQWWGLEKETEMGTFRWMGI